MRPRRFLCVLAALSFVVTGVAELQKLPVEASHFRTTEYKILLDIPGISAHDSIAATYKKIDQALVLGGTSIELVAADEKIQRYFSG